MMLDASKMRQRSVGIDLGLSTTIEVLSLLIIFSL